MAERHLCAIRALGVSIECEFLGAPAAVGLREAQLAWGDLLTLEYADATSRVTFTAENEDMIPNMLDSMSSRVTLAAIEARAGELLLLHACGLRLPGSDRVVACVAASGTGKTTMSRSAAGVFEYVSDETVGVTSAGRIVPYPKSLSIKQTEEAGAYRPKVQRNPRGLGLEVVPAHDELHLGGVVLLDRDSDAPLVSMNEVDLFEAIIMLVPQLSYLTRMERPLHRIAEAIIQTGGVKRLRYAEANAAIQFLQTEYEPFHSSAVTHPYSNWGEETPFELQRLDAARREFTAWVERVCENTPESEAPSNRTVQAAEYRDVLYDERNGHCLIFCDGQVLQGSPITLAVLLAAGTPLSRERLVRILVALFGEPEGGARATVNAVLDELRRRNVLITP